MSPTLLAGISAQFTWVDWLIVVGYLAFTTWLGAKMAGRQATIRDFFLGGRKLPWYAVSGSIIATEISALTFISVPWVVFMPGGNFTYLQLGVIGSFLARIIVGYVLVPAYYQREIYSPYDYMGNQLGGRVRSMTTVLFTVGGMLAQSARVYLTAEVVIVVLNDQLTWLSETLGLNPLAWAIILIALVSVGWTLIGGITTVIWTDVILFLCFLLGAFVALGTAVHNLAGGWGEFFSVGWAARESGIWGKFTFFDFSTSPLRTYTIWTAAIASTWGGLGAYGTDQLLAQRMFCCRNTRDARWAIISSTASQIVTITVMLVGVGLFVYYQANPLRGEAAELVARKGDRVFPVFIVEVIPRGLKGLIIAGVFAAAISSLMGILTALSQTCMSAFYNPLRERHLRRRGLEVSLTGNIEELAEKRESSAEDKRSVLVGRLMVLFWGIVLSLMAYLARVVSEFYPSILDLGLAMAGYVGGALLAGFALSFLPLKIDGRGFMYSGPLSAVCVFALVWHQPWTHVVCWIFTVAFLFVWIWQLSKEPHDWPKTLVLLAGLALMLWLNYYGYWEVEDDQGKLAVRTIAWPWYAPIGSSVAFIWGYLLARRRGEVPSDVRMPTGAQ
jgi:Na+/proline symporter